VPVSNDISVLGINEAIRSLNKIEPGLRKEFNNEARAIAAPATDAVRSAYRFVPLSGMNRQWAGPAVNNRANNTSAPRLNRPERITQRA